MIRGTEAMGMAVAKTKVGANVRWGKVIDGSRAGQGMANCNSKMLPITKHLFPM